MQPDLIAYGRTVRTARLSSNPTVPSDIYSPQHEAHTETTLIEHYSQAVAFQMILFKNAETSPLACECVRWMLIHPTKNAGCERRFSLMDRVKKKMRLCLSHGTLSDLMHISTNALRPDTLNHR